MEAANARIIAFGASMAIINGVADSFKAMVRNMVEVEKSLADINVVMGLNAQSLDKFSDGLFKVAKETGAAFKIAADAATEYARQGLNVEESLKRTKDALILTRLTGMDSAEAVKSLTAAMNTYGHQIKDTTQLVSKFAAVDVKFAVSAEDFADAISRTGAAAKGAGVDIDELIGLVTAAQQQTARGGKVIGNSFKTIFTRIGRTDTLNQLENLGIAVRDIEGKTLGAKRILSDLANTFDTLSEAQKAQIAQTVGGVFQINVLKAVLGDAAKQNGILANATQISASATNEAITKNEQLRNTMAAMATETGLAIKQVSAQAGEIALGPGIEKVLNTVKALAENISGSLGDGEGAGNEFAKGLLRGIGNVITGPGLVVLTTVFIKLFGQAFKFTRDSLGSLIGITSEAQKQKAIQTSLVTLFGQNAALSKEMLRTDISRTEKEKVILGLLKAQVAEANVLNNVSKQAAATLYSKGFGASLTPRKGRAYGHIPNFAHPEREQAAKGGYSAGNIREMNMPGEGPIIYNSSETVKNFKGMNQPAIMPPQSSKAGKNYQQAFGDIHGFDPYAAGGYIPNFSQGTANADKRMVVFAASSQGGGKFSGQDNVNNKFFISPPKKKNESYKFADISKQGLRGANPRGMVPVNVPYFTIGKNDANLDNHPDAQSFIYNQMQKAGQKVAQDAANKLFKVQNASVKRIETKDIAASSGNIFEAAIMAAESLVARKSMGPNPVGNTLLDIPRSGRDKLWKLFGAGPLGGLGAEAKIALGGESSGKGGKHLKSAAEKFYKIDIKKQAPFGDKASKTTVSKSSELGSNNKANLLTKKSGNILYWGQPIDKTNKGQQDSIRQTFSNTDFGKEDITARLLDQKFNIKASGFIPNFAKVKWSIDKKKGQYGLTGSHMELMQFVDYLERAGVEPKKLEVLKTRIKKIQSNVGKKRTEFKQNNVPGFGRSGARYYDQLRAISEGSYLDTKGTFIKDLGKHVKDFNRGGGMFAAGLNAGKGFIPNFAADPLTDAIGRERDAGIPVSQIRVGTHSALMNKGNPIGLGVTNTKDEPNGLRDVFGSANGFVPNYAIPTLSAGDMGFRIDKTQQQLADQYNSELKKRIKRMKKGDYSFQQLQRSISTLNNRYNISASAQQNVNKEIRSLSGPIISTKRAFSSLTKGASSLNKKFAGTSIGKGLSSSGAQMGLIMGAPMLGGMLQGEGPGKVGNFQYQAGGALTGIGTGASMGMMFGPLGAAIGGVVGGFSGLLSSSNELKEAQEKAAESIAQRKSESILTSPVANEAFGKIGEDQMGKLAALEKELQKSFEPQLKKQLANIENNRRAVVSKGTNMMVPGASSALNLGFSTRKEKAITENSVKLNVEAAKQRKSALLNALKTLDPSTEFMGKDIKTGKEKAYTTSSFIEDINQLDITKEEDQKALKKAFENGKTLQEKINLELEKQRKAVILQLNLQKAMIHAQQKSAEAQLDIKAEYIDMSNSLKTEKQLMGSLISEERKARIDFIGAINKAEEAYKLGTNQAKSEFKKGLISDISSGQNAGLTQALKQNLFKDLDEADLKDKTTVDLTNELNSKSAEDLLQILKDIGVNEDQANKIVENRSLLYQNQITLLDKQKTISDSQANSELTINNILGKRRELLEDMNQSIQNFNRNSSFLSESSALDKRIADAGRSVGGYTSKQKQLQIDRSDLESRIVPDMVRKSSGAKLGILQQASKDLEIGGFTDEEIDKILKMEGKEVDISSILESRFKDAGGKNEITNLQDVLGGYGKDLLSDEEFQQTVGGGETRQEMKQRLEELKILDQQRLGVNGDLNKEIKNINDSLIQQNILKEKGVQAVESELSAREKNDRYMRGQSVTIDGQVDDRSAITRGMSNSFAEMRDQAQYMHYEIGKRVPNLLADGLAEAMQVALNGADDLGDAMTQIGINFLQSIQSAFLQQAAQGIVGAMGFKATNRYNGGHIRNYSKGGSVPAMVSDGEYLMSKEAVNRYGGSFMHTLNAGGKIPKYANGGWVDSGLSGAFSSSPSASSSFNDFFTPQPEFSVLPPRSFKDRMMDFMNDTDNMKLFEQEYQKAETEAFAPTTPLSDVFSNPPGSSSSVDLASVFSSPPNSSPEIFTEPKTEFSVLPPRSFKNRMMDFLDDSDNMKLFEEQYALAQKKAAGIGAFSLKNQPSPQQKMERATSPFDWSQNSDGSVNFGSTLFESPLRRATTVSDVSGSASPEMDNWDPFALIDPDKMQGPPMVDKSADILKSVEDQLIKQRSAEIMKKGANISDIRRKYDYLLNKVRNENENVFDHSVERIRPGVPASGKNQFELMKKLYGMGEKPLPSWATEGSPDYLLPPFIRNKPIDKDYKKRGFKYGGKTKKFAEGGKVPEDGSALAADFAGGRAFESGKAYQSKAMSGYFYSGLAGNVGIEDDASKLREVLAEEERQRQKALMKKRKKQQFWQSLAGTALSAGIAWGTNKFGSMFQKPDATLDLSREAILNAPSESFDMGLGDSFGSFDNISSLGSSSLANQYDYFGRPKIGRNSGGFIRKYAGGGYISGKSGIDQIPAMLSEGEYVIKASSARKLGKSTLDSINAGKFNDGGPVSGEFGSSDSNISGGNTNNINISINMEQGKASSESEQKSGQNPAEQSEEQSSNVALADKIKQQVVSVIVEEQRPGGLLSG
jgi:TP901 family phage tail tape measure protein